MPDIPADVLPRLQEWWQTQEPGNHAIFEAIYLDAPGAVSNAISGGAWVADGPEPGLAAQLGADGGAGSYGQIPMLNAGAQPEIPMYGVAGSDMTIRWSELNDSRVALGAYVTDVYVQDQSGTQIAGVRLDGAGVEPGASAAREWTYTLPADVAAGNYNVTIYMNAEGSDAGSGVAGAQGFRGITSGVFDVGQSESMASNQDVTLWLSAVGSFESAATMTGEQALESLKEGMNWLAAVEGLDEDDKKRVADFGADLDIVQPQDWERFENNDRLAMLGGVASQSGWENEDSRKRVIDALTAIKVKF